MAGRSHAANDPVSNEAAKAHEGGLALFICPEWRVRFRASLVNPRLRKKLRQDLPHFRHLDPRFASRVRGADQRADWLAEELLKRGADRQCHIVSEDDELDGKDMPLLDALVRVVDEGSLAATFISCVPGRLAYFHDEERDNRYILSRA